MKKFISVLFVLLLSACSNAQEQGMIKNYPIGTEQFVQFKLEPRLNEISGLTFSSDGRLFAHNDEKAAIFELDINSGKILKTFYLGTLTVNRDFEDIVLVGKTFYMITSDGQLFVFQEGDDGTNVDYEVVDLKISDKFDIEGLCYAPANNSLLITSKDYPGKKYKDSRTVYEYYLESGKLNSKPKFVISLNELKQKFDIKDFYPSAIAMHPGGNSYFITSAKGGACIVEIDTKGNLVSAKKLNDKIHRQPEGIAFLTDGVMFIADEAAGKKPTLTKYFPLN